MLPTDFPGSIPWIALRKLDNHDAWRTCPLLANLRRGRMHRLFFGKRLDEDEPRLAMRAGGADMMTRITLGAHLQVNLSRPITVAITEPICIFWNCYIGIVYGILYF